METLAESRIHARKEYGLAIKQAVTTANKSCDAVVELVQHIGLFEVEMNCSKCGLQTQPDQRFCRSCGNDLRIVTQPLVERPALSEPQKTPVPDLISKRQGPNGLTRIGFILMFIGIAIGIIGGKMMPDGIIAAVGALLAVAGMFFTAYPYLLPARQQQFDARPSQPENLIQSQPAKYLPQETNIEYVPSVTDGTTALLDNSISLGHKRKKDKESEA